MRTADTRDSPRSKVRTILCILTLNLQLGTKLAPSEPPTHFIARACLWISTFDSTCSSLASAPTLRRELHLRTVTVRSREDTLLLCVAPCILCMQGPRSLYQRGALRVAAHPRIAVGRLSVAIAGGPVLLPSRPLYYRGSRCLVRWACRPCPPEVPRPFARHPAAFSSPHLSRGS